MINKILAPFFIICAVSITNAHAGGSVSGKILKVRVDNPSGQTMVYFDTNLAGSPATCIHPSYANVLAIDTTTQGGKSVLSVALTANATKADVEATGKGICGVYGTNLTEVLDAIVVK